MSNSTSVRYVFLDTETTGLKVAEGHRIFDLACIEVVGDDSGRNKTGRFFQAYANPQVPLSKDSASICNIEDAFLQDKPAFSEIVDGFLQFINYDSSGNKSPAVLVAHNKNFDLSFLNNELKLLNLPDLKDFLTVDTVKIAKKKFPDKMANLNNLCKIHGLDLADRDANGHGALRDTELLVDLFLLMCANDSNDYILNIDKAEQIFFGINKRPIVLPVRFFTITETEMETHSSLLSALGATNW